MYDNTINSAGAADGIRAVGALLNIQRNTFNVPGTGAIMKHYNDGYANSQQYGTLAYFSHNTWAGVGMTYNVSNSAVTVQSEYIPSPPPGEYPVQLVWSAKRHGLQINSRPLLFLHLSRSARTAPTLRL